MPDLEAMKRDLLAEARDDHVGLWSVIRYVEDEFPKESEEKIRQITLDILHDLLESGQIEAGFPDTNGVDFHPWPFRADVVMEQIKKQWPANGTRPKVGEVAWFTAPT